MGSPRSSIAGNSARRARRKTARCPWCGSDPIYVAYHDCEWGVPVMDDRALFEKLVLDGGFDPERIARFGAADRRRLLANADIIRSRAKIDAAILNARVWLEVMQAGGRGAFRDLLWQSVNHETIVHRYRSMRDVPPTSRESEVMSRTLRDAGFRFCGPTICYAFMQAVGMVNDHLMSCPRHEACERLARRH
jgi:DNA-3-methyladenine glycosylase I